LIQNKQWVGVMISFLEDMVDLTIKAEPVDFHMVVDTVGFHMVEDTVDFRMVEDMAEDIHMVEVMVTDGDWEYLHMYLCNSLLK
jgi:hypothetical protein